MNAIEEKDRPVPGMSLAYLPDSSEVYATVDRLDMIEVYRHGQFGLEQLGRYRIARMWDGLWRIVKPELTPVEEMEFVPEALADLKIVPTYTEITNSKDRLAALGTLLETLQ